MLVKVPRQVIDSVDVRAIVAFEPGNFLLQGRLNFDCQRLLKLHIDHFLLDFLRSIAQLGRINADRVPNETILTLKHAFLLVSSSLILRIPLVQLIELLALEHIIYVPILVIVRGIKFDLLLLIVSKAIIGRASIRSERVRKVVNCLTLLNDFPLAGLFKGERRLG